MTSFVKLMKKLRQQDEAKLKAKFPYMSLLDAARDGRTDEPTAPEKPGGEVDELVEEIMADFRAEGAVAEAAEVKAEEAPAEEEEVLLAEEAEVLPAEAEPEVEAAAPVAESAPTVVAKGTVGESAKPAPAAAARPEASAPAEVEVSEDIEERAMRALFAQEEGASEKPATGAGVTARVAEEAPAEVAERPEEKAVEEAAAREPEAAVAKMPEAPPSGEAAGEAPAEAKEKVGAGEREVDVEAILASVSRRDREEEAAEQGAEKAAEAPQKVEAAPKAEAGGQEAVPDKSLTDEDETALRALFGADEGVGSKEVQARAGAGGAETRTKTRGRTAVMEAPAPPPEKKTSEEKAGPDLSEADLLQKAVARESWSEAREAGPPRAEWGGAAQKALQKVSRVLNPNLPLGQKWAFGLIAIAVILAVLVAAALRIIKG